MLSHPIFKSPTTAQRSPKHTIIRLTLKKFFIMTVINSARKLLAPYFSLPNSLNRPKSSKKPPHWRICQNIHPCLPHPPPPPGEAAQDEASVLCEVAVAHHQLLAARDLVHQVHLTYSVLGKWLNGFNVREGFKNSFSVIRCTSPLIFKPPTH